MSARRASIEDVAAGAQVSITTVSHALSGKRGVSEATLNTVQVSVQRLGHRPSVAARSLRGQRSHTIALMVADITNPYYPAVARSVHDYLVPAGYLAFVCNTGGTQATERMFLRELVARDVDGLIVEHLSLSVQEICSIVGAEIPLVMIGPKGPLSNVDQVGTDDSQGIKECIDFLRTHGISDIAFVSGPTGKGPGDIRSTAFKNAMTSAGKTVRSSDRVPSAIHPTPEKGRPGGREDLGRSRAHCGRSCAPTT